MYFLKDADVDDIEHYKDDYNQVIRLKEYSPIPFYHRSPQIHHRPALIKHLKQLCLLKRYNYETLHLAIYLLDLFMDNHNIADEKIYLIANCCLWIASKNEEVLANIMTISDFNMHSPAKYKPNSYTKTEILLMHFFNWNLRYPTTASYIFYYMQKAIRKEDAACLKKSFRTILDMLHLMVYEYLDKIITDVHYMQFYRASKMAAAVISISRLQLGLSGWTMELAEFTDYNESDILRTRKALLQSNMRYECCAYREESDL